MYYYVSMNLNIFLNTEVESAGLSMKKSKKYVHEDPILTKIQGMSLISSGEFGFSCHRWVKDMVILRKSHKYNLITILLEILHCLVSLFSFEIQLQNTLKHGAVHFLVTTPAI